MNTELTKDDGYRQLVTRISDVYTTGRVRADYGKALLASLSRDLTRLHGKCFSRSNLVHMRLLYVEFPISAKPSHQLNFPEK